MTEPLLAWTRPLTSAERRADREAALRMAPVVFSIVAPNPWLPMLPPDVPQCKVCKMPNRSGLCAGCRKLKKAFGWPVDSVEMLTVSTRRDDPEHLIWGWKEEAEAMGLTHAPDDWLGGIGARLSAYLKAHARRLLDGEPIVTSIPSRAPLVACALDTVAARDRLSARIERTGDKNGSWLQHKMAGQGARLARTTADWRVDGCAVSGRHVVLIDDVLVTGASMFSYAAALKSAGARDVRCVVIARHVRDTHSDYFDALRIVRRTRKWEWSPARSAVAYG
jgi:hypothetical protein